MMDIQGLKDKILQLAIQGKLVEQDENDEPASVLLENIMEEKKKLVKENKIRNEKILPEITEEEKAFDIPKGWEWVRFQEVLDVRDGTHDTPKYVDDGIPLITSKNLINGKINFGDIRLISIDDHNKISERSNVDNGDVLFAMIGSIGNPVIVNEKRKFSIKNVALFKHYQQDLINSKYLYYYLYFVQKEMKQKSSGGVQSFVSLTFLRNYTFPLPPLEEQKRIVAKIDQLFTLVDELATNKGDLLETINLTRNQVLQEAIQGKLVERNQDEEPASILLEKIKKEKEKLIKEKKIRKQKPLLEIAAEEKPFEIPEGWEWVRLGDIINLISGRDLPVANCNEEGNGIPYIMGASNINNGKLLIQRWIDKPQVIAKKDDIIITVKGTVGKIVLLKDYDEVNLSRQVMGIRQIHSEFPNYLYYFVESHLSTIINKSQGVIPGISREDILGIMFPFPPIAEQKRIVKKIDIIMDMLNSLEEQLIKDYI